MAHLGKTLGQDVLEEALEELGHRQGQMSDLLTLVVSIAEGHPTVRQRLQTRVAQGDAEDVAAQILEDFFSAPGVLGVNDPVLAPELGRDLVQ